MATAKEQAQINLGDIRDYVNYGGYQDNINNARANYDATMQSLQNTYNRLINSANAERQQVGRDFTSGRSTVANRYYTQNNLNTGAQLSSYLRGTGVDAANKVPETVDFVDEESDDENVIKKGKKNF